MANNYQFGRFVEVEVRNFDSKVKTIIGNEFEIEFEYFKSLDQTQQDDSGKIKIYGLTKERVESMQSEGGEVRLRCGYTNSQIETLFIASISRIYSNTVNNTTETVIECSANLLNYYYTGGVTVDSNSPPTLVNLAGIYAKKLGAKGSLISLPVDPNITPKIKKDLERFLKTYVVYQSFVGSLDTVVRNFCDTFKFLFRRQQEDDGSFIAVFELTLFGAVVMLKIMEEGYKGVEADPNQESKDAAFMGTLKADDESTSVTVLDPQTGLIEAKTEYKIATAYIDEELSKDDVETIKSRQNRANDAVREANRREREAKKAAQAAAKGKEYKKSDWKKRETIKITRKYNRVKALLNPMVKPQSAIAVLEEKTNEGDAMSNRADNIDYDTVAMYTQYRVRNATYKGNNKRGDWIMDLYCEDSDISSKSEADLKKLQYSTSSEDFQVEGLEVEGLEDLVNE